MHRGRYPRRSILAATFTIVASVTLAGCATMFVAPGGPVPAGPLGPVVPSLNGGPPVECRGVPLQQCRESWGGGDLDATIVRLIITCTKVCTPTEGEYNVHALRANGSVESMGGGAYAGAGAGAGG